MSGESIALPHVIIVGMAELDVGGKIAKLRKERGFTQKDLADF